MHVKPFLALAACSIALMVPAGAAPATPRPAAARAAGVARARWGAVLSRLDLTEAQRSRVRDILRDARARAQSIRSDAGLTAAQKRTRLQSTMAAARRQIASVLTPQQKAKLARLMRLRRPELRRLLVRLNLTAAQKQALRGYVRDSGAAARGIRENTGLTPEQKRARLLEVRRQLHQQIFAVLTPAQRARVRAWLRA